MKMTVLSMLQIPICFPSPEQTAAPGAANGQTPLLAARGTPVGCLAGTTELATVCKVVGLGCCWTTSFSLPKVFLPGGPPAAVAVLMGGGENCGCTPAGLVTAGGGTTAAAEEEAGGGAAADEEEPPAAG